MAKWNPKTDPVGKNEPIGRRLFDEPMLVGAEDQPSFNGLDYRHFEETRDRELSLDRLGQTGIDRRARNYLRPRADAAGTKFVPPKQFNGWIHVRASALVAGWQGKSFPVTASPIDGDGLEENTHHAHVSIKDDPIVAALYLRELFTRLRTVEKVEPPNVLKKVSTWQRVMSLVRSRWKEITSRAKSG
jgi:hypothetical protein